MPIILLLADVKQRKKKKKGGSLGGHPSVSEVQRLKWGSIIHTNPAEQYAAVCLHYLSFVSVTRHPSWYGAGSQKFCSCPQSYSKYPPNKEALAVCTYLHPGREPLQPLLGPADTFPKGSMIRSSSLWSFRPFLDLCLGTSDRGREGKARGFEEAGEGCGVAAGGVTSKQGG